MSAEEVGDVSPATATVTLTVPAVDVAGELTLSEVVEAVDTVAVVAPNFTVSFAAVAENPFPAIVTVVPPAIAPDVGDTDVTVGATASAIVPLPVSVNPPHVPPVSEE